MIIRHVTPEMLKTDAQLEGLCGLRRLTLAILPNAVYRVTSLNAATFDGTRAEVVAYVIGFDAAVERCRASFDKLELDIHAILKEHR